jgi:hypothetical protein
LPSGIAKHGVNAGWFKRGQKGWRLGVKVSPETRERLRTSHLGQPAWNKGSGKPTNNALIEWLKNNGKGERHPNWKGGISKNVHSVTEPKYKIWRSEVFERDDFTCRECGRKGVYLEAHHIQSWSKYPDLRYEISNGLTLCQPCHAKTPDYRGKNHGPYRSDIGKSEVSGTVSG